MTAFDVLLRNCRIVDGTGSPSFRGDVAVAGTAIAVVGVLDGAEAETAIDCEGLVVAPGFVDAHIHTDSRLFSASVQAASVFQGVTTHVVGQDGFGFAPTAERSFAFMEAYTSGINGRPVPFRPGGVGEFLGRFDGATAVNVATLVPNGCVRLDVLGNSARAATAAELEEMASLCRRAMREGAVGLSSGLDYVPSRYASTDELVALCAAVAETGGIYVSHIRYEDGLLPALEEAIEVGRRAALPVHVSHLRGEQELGADAGKLLALVDSARRDALDVTYDAYPYTYGSSFLPFVLPPWALEGDAGTILARLADPGVRARIRADVPSSRWSWAKMVVAGDPGPDYTRYVGLGLEEAAAAAGQDPVDFVCGFLLAEQLGGVLVWTPDDSPSALEDLYATLRHPAQMVGSDGIYNPGRAHPRGYGAFARFVGRFVRDERIFTLEDAVRRATSFPARRFQLAGRGLVQPGCAADLVVFDPETFTDRATDEDSAVLADGMRDVFVNGVAVLRHGRLTGATPGRGLRRGEATSG